MTLTYPAGTAVSQTCDGVPFQPEGALEAGGMRRQGHFHRTAGRDDVALLDIGSVVPPADRLAPKIVPLVEGRVEGEEDRFVGCHIPVGPAVDEAAHSRSGNGRCCAPPGTCA